MPNKKIPITIEAPEEIHQRLLSVVENCNLANQRRDSFTSHGPLTVEGLLTMLAEDAAMTVSRPGSWEAANMLTVLNSHGYY